MDQKLFSGNENFKLTNLIINDNGFFGEIEITAETLNAFPFYVLLIDEDHHILFANTATINVLGKSQEEILGAYCPFIIHGLSHPFPGCPLEEAYKSGHSVEREFFDPNTQRWVDSAAYFTNLKTQKGKSVFLHMIRDITDHKNSDDQLEYNLQKQNVINQLLQASLRITSIQEFSSRVLDLITSIPKLSLLNKAGVFLVEDDPQVLVLQAHRGLEKLESSCAKVQFGYCLCGRAAETGKIVYADHIDERHEVIYNGITPHGHYCVAIRSAERILGVLCLYIPNGSLRDKRTEEFLIAVADLFAGFIEREKARQDLTSSLEKVRSALGGTIQALSQTVESRDPYTAGHQQRVSDLARAIATEMGLTTLQIDGIRLAGSIHDIGKISIPSEILSKPSRLNDIEFSLIKTHPQVGYEILKNIEFPWPIAQIILQHHERLNGTGYPNGISGEEICLEARVLTVADVVEAMSSHRPYRAALSIDEALDEIKSKSKIFFDPNVVSACLNLFLVKGYQIN